MNTSHEKEVLSGKKVIVVGGSSGMGLSVAAAAVARDAAVVLSSSSQDYMKKAIERLKQRAEGRPNVSVEGHVFDTKNFGALKKFLSKEGPFDHLVIIARGLLKTLELPINEITADLKHQFDMRYWAWVIIAQHIRENKLIGPGGSITFTTSAYRYRPIPGWELTNGIAGALESSTRGLAIDLKPIRVNTIAIGVVETELPTETREGVIRSCQENLLVGHVGTTDEAAEAYIFAIECNFLTGQVIVVDGEGLLV